MPINLIQNVNLNEKSGTCRCRYWKSVSNNISPNEKKNYKYFNGYLYDFEITSLHIMLPKTRAHVKSYGT